MVKTMKRGLSLMLALLMLLCMFPVSAFAADKKCTFKVSKDNAAVRAEAHDYGEIVERYAKGKSVTYTRLYINDALNLWYGIPIEGTDTYKYIYSGNVKSVSNGAKVSAVVEMSRDLLTKNTCLEQAKKLLATGYKKDQIKKELYAHARIYYQSVVVELTEDLICTLFPNQCLSYQEAVDLVKDIVQEVKSHAAKVDIGGGTTIRGQIKISESTLQALYNWIWFRY